MAIDTIKSTAVLDGSITGDDIAYPLTAFSSTGIDDNATSTAMTLDSSGNLLVGKTADNVATVGIEARATGPLISTRDGSDALRLNRLSSDGEIIQLRKDGTTVGSIGSFNGNAYYAGTGCGLRPRTGDISPTNASGSTNDGGVDLGTSANRFQNIFLSGGAYLGGTGSANHLDDYEEGTWTIALQNVSSGLLNSGTSSHNVYTKIGRVVHLDGYFSFNSNSSDSDAVAIGGLPFAVKSNTYSNGSQICQYGSGFAMTPFAVSGSTYLHLYRNDNGTGNAFDQMTYGEVGQLAMHFSITYITDS